MASIKCGNCKSKHQSVRAVKACYDTRNAIWQIPAAPGYLTTTWHGFRIISVDEAIAEDDEFAAEQAAEIWAENAWLRAAEAGTPDTWREDQLERMAASSGLPVPPGFY